MRHVLRPGAVGACPRLRAYGLAVAVAGCLMADPASAALGPQLISEFDPATARVAVAPARRLTMAIAAPAIRPLRLAQVWGRQRPRVSRGFFGGGSDTPIFRPKMSAAPTAMRVKRLAPAFAPRNPSGVWITGFGPSGDTAYPSNTPPGLRPAYSVAPIHALRTVCVRLCDGYYWPISYSAPRSRFYHDANVCQSSCAGEARLFHYPTSGGSIEDAVDQTGRVYGRLANAYRYRKALVEGCACKPAPWSEAEVIRHERYALAEKAAAPSRVAGTSADASAAGPGGLLLDAGETRHAGIGPAAGVDDQRAANGAAVEARPEPRRRAAAASEKPASRRIADRPAQLRRVAAIASEQAAPGQQSPQRRRRIVAPAG